jgi:hypothetical protein
MLLRLLALVLIGCSQISPEGTKDPTDIPQVPSVETKFTVKIEASNYTSGQAEKLARVEKEIERIFNSEEFKVEVLISGPYSSTTLSPEDIYEKLMKGAETLNPSENRQMDLEVEMYFKKYTKVVGYTYPGSNKVMTNSKFHDKYDHCRVASNLTHEWSHKLGFSHSSASDSRSVPYSLNRIIEKLCLK